MLTNKRGRPIITNVDELPTLLGQEVRRARTARGLTLRQLAEKAGQPYTSIYNIEIGTSIKPDEAALRAIADALEPETSIEKLALLVYNVVPAEEELVPA